MDQLVLTDREKGDDGRAISGGQGSDPGTRGGTKEGAGAISHLGGSRPGKYNRIRVRTGCQLLYMKRRGESNRLQTRH
mgnify:CR=1 FL=1